MRRRTIYLLLAAILAGAAALYLPTTEYEPIWDTRDFLRKSVLLTQDRPLADAFRGGYIYGQFGMNAQSMYYRPMVTLSFMLEKRLWGLSIARLRTTNIAFFLCLVILVFTLIRTWGGTAATALTAAAFFAASPINPGNVVWVVGRGDLLMLLWGMVTLILLRKRPQWGLWVRPAAWVSFLLAALSKETALMFIPLLWLADPPGTTWKQRFHHLGFPAIGAGFLVVKHGLLGIGTPALLFSARLLDYPLRGLAVLGHYTSVLVLPFHLPLFNFVSQVETPFHMGIGAITALVLAWATMRLIRPGQSDELRLITAMSMLFLIPFVWMGFTSMWPFRLSSRYMMAASVGVFWLAAAAMQKLPPLLRRVMPAALILLFVPSLMQHNAAHRTELTYWRRALEDHPQHPAMMLKLAETHFMQQNDLAAYALLQRNQGQRARRLTALKQHMLLAKLEYQRLDYETALHHLDAAEPLDAEGSYQAGLLRARIIAHRGDPAEESRSILESLIRKAPQRPEAYTLLHRILTGRSDWSAADRLEAEARRTLGPGIQWNTTAMARRFATMPPRNKVGFLINHLNPSAALRLWNRLPIVNSLDNRLFAAWIVFQWGNQDQAFERIRAAAESFSKPEDHARIGRFFLDHLKRPETALTWLRQALRQREDAHWRDLVRQLETLADL